MPVRDLTLPQAHSLRVWKPHAPDLPQGPCLPSQDKTGPLWLSRTGLRRTGAALGAQVRDQAARETQVHFIPCSAS